MKIHTRTERILLVLFLGIFLTGCQQTDRMHPFIHWSFEQIEHSITPDGTGQYTGQIQGEPLQGDGVKGKCLILDGVKDYIIVPEISVADFDESSFSISVWVNSHALNVGNQTILAQYSDKFKQLDWVLKVNDRNHFQFSSGHSEIQFIDSKTKIQPGHWYHLTVACAPDHTRLYVNGELENESAINMGNVKDGFSFTIGALIADSELSDMLYGAVDEILLMKKIPSEKTIKKTASQANSIKTKYNSLLSADWDPLEAGNEVLSNVIDVTASHVKGAHDAEFEVVGNKAYIVSTVNDIKSGHSSSALEYAAMSIVDLETMDVVKASLPIAKSEQSFENETLPFGQTWVPRIIQKDSDTLRVFFLSQLNTIEAKKVNLEAHSKIWYQDFNLKTQTFKNRIYPAKLKTYEGTFDFIPECFHADAVADGFKRELSNNGIFIFDSFKRFDDITYVTINNFPGRQNSLAKLNETLDTFEIVGHINAPHDLASSESSVNRWPDGTWVAILRTEEGARNYAFSESVDGRDWNTAAYRGFLRTGTTSKPTFNRFNNIYYLGWQDVKRIDGITRSVFNVDISRDGRIWERKYRFETPDCFEYPTFKEQNGAIWLTFSGNRESTIKFGKLESL